MRKRKTGVKAVTIATVKTSKTCNSPLSHFHCQSYCYGNPPDQSEQRTQAQCKMKTFAKVSMDVQVCECRQERLGHFSKRTVGGNASVSSVMTEGLRLPNKPRPSVWLLLKCRELMILTCEQIVLDMNTSLQYCGSRRYTNKP